MELIQIAQEIGVIQLNMEQFARYPNRYISLTNTALEAAQYLIEAALGATYDHKNLETGGVTIGSQEMIKRIERLYARIEGFGSGLDIVGIRLLRMAGENITMAALWLKHYKEHNPG